MLDCEGEWRGVSTSYTPKGTAIMLPFDFISEYYKQENTRVYEWQTQCSMNANDNDMNYSLRRLYSESEPEPDLVALTEKSSGFRTETNRYVYTACRDKMGNLCACMNADGRVCLVVKF